ncbi:MAG: 5-(carboxyamino)imidazole ribonucleotide mutase [Candidatus Omnitrophica bacterium]|nr:5-(carboxyamino)imidazole ribonucleotide mutase [Candidatus Omnitrophota bacterium]
MKQALVAILMGSDSDWPVMESAATVLKDFGLSSDVRVLSAHRSPAPLRQYVERASRQGTAVFIAAAGGAAHLAGAVAAHTIRPVIGVPVSTPSLNGLDSLLSTVQMPRGVPVATVAIGNAANAAILAVQMLALHDAALRAKLTAYKRELARKCLQADRALGKRIPRPAETAPRRPPRQKVPPAGRGGGRA